jgi:hypothetical protein
MQNEQLESMRPLAPAGEIFPYQRLQYDHIFKRLIGKKNQKFMV